MLIQLLMLLVCLFSTSCQNSSSVADRIAAIPEADRELLEEFFRQLMVTSNFSYTLFGDKPMSFAEYYEEPDAAFECFRDPHYFVFLREGWNTWEKYQHLFPSSDYVIKKMPSRSGYQFIVMINKPAFLKIAHENSDLLEQDEDSFFEQFISSHAYFEDAMKKDQALIGIFLGFGRQNSLLFKERDQCDAELRRRHFSPLFKSQNTGKNSGCNFLRCPQKFWTSASYSIESTAMVTAKLQEANKRVTGFASRGMTWLTELGDVGFVCDDRCDETELLKEKYANTFHEAVQKYRSHCFLAITLEQLCR